MDKKLVSGRLRKLATDESKRSKAARLRDVIDDVENALAAGVTRAHVLLELNACGLDMSLATFETTLKRIRAQRNRAVLPTLSSRKLISEQQTTATQQSLSAGKDCASHNPADIDGIIRAKPDLAALSKIARRSKK